MTKLEEKLIELGYEQFIRRGLKWVKGSNGYAVVVDTSVKPIKSYVVLEFSHLDRQWEIDNLQLAFNEMQKDLEILKECEENEN